MRIYPKAPKTNNKKPPQISRTGRWIKISPHRILETSSAAENTGYPLGSQELTFFSPSDISLSGSTGRLEKELVIWMKVAHFLLQPKLAASLISE